MYSQYKYFVPACLALINLVARTQKLEYLTACFSPRNLPVLDQVKFGGICDIAGTPLNQGLTFFTTSIEQFPEYFLNQFGERGEYKPCR
jgi:hypothetical protein